MLKEINRNATTFTRVLSRRMNWTHSSLLGIWDMIVFSLENMYCKRFYILSSVCWMKTVQILFFPIKTPGKKKRVLAKPPPFSHDSSVNLYAVLKMRGKKKPNFEVYYKCYSAISWCVLFIQCTTTVFSNRQPAWHAVLSSWASAAMLCGTLDITLEWEMGTLEKVGERVIRSLVYVTEEKVLWNLVVCFREEQSGRGSCRCIPSSPQVVFLFHTLFCSVHYTDLSVLKILYFSLFNFWEIINSNCYRQL